MATIKSYTDLKQSKKLFEFLPIESADMYYWHGSYRLIRVNDGQCVDIDVPAWSFAALFDILPDGTDVTKDKSDTENEKYMCTVLVNDSLVTTFANNPIDACVGMILKLDKLNQL